MAHCARMTEDILVTDEDLLLQGIFSMRRPQLNETLVRCPDALTMPRKSVRIHVRGPPNARLWGTWSLDKNCGGTFEGVTCALARAKETCHVEHETFTMLCMGGAWEFAHVDVRAGGPAGALCLFYDSEVNHFVSHHNLQIFWKSESQVAMLWCGLAARNGLRTLEPTPILNVEPSQVTPPTPSRPLPATPCPLPDTLQRTPTRMQVVLRWCGRGGMDDGEYRCNEGLVVRDAATCNVSASVFEFCGEGCAGCNPAVSVQVRAHKEAPTHTARAA